MMARTRFSWAAMAVVALAGPGCGGGKVKVSGVVTLDGQPIEGAMVAFVPVDEGKGAMAHGTTDKDGVFQLTTTKPNDGAAPGEYKVTVVYAEGAEAPPAGGMKEAFEGFEKAHKQKQKPPRYNVPARYGDPAKTDLRQKVPPDGKVTFDLKSGK
jgi:hypothetical protein